MDRTEDRLCRSSTVLFLRPGQGHGRRRHEIPGQRPGHHHRCPGERRRVGRLSEQLLPAVSDPVERFVFPPDRFVDRILDPPGYRHGTAPRRPHFHPDRVRTRSPPPNPSPTTCNPGKRATLVGEPTKGGAHSVDVFGIDDRFEFYISTERAVSPVTGGNWEGTGVIPDIRVPAAVGPGRRRSSRRKRPPRAYGRSQDEALERVVRGDAGRSRTARPGSIARERTRPPPRPWIRCSRSPGGEGMISEFFRRRVRL